MGILIFILMAFLVALLIYIVKNILSGIPIVIPPFLQSILVYIFNFSVNLIIKIWPFAVFIGSAYIGWMISKMVNENILTQLIGILIGIFFAAGFIGNRNQKRY